VREVPAYCDTEGMAVPRYEFNIEELARVELDAREEDEGGRSSMLRDDGEDVFSRKIGTFSRRRCDSDKGGKG
jgi:hypothetical protein